MRFPKYVYRIFESSISTICWVNPTMICAENAGRMSVGIGGLGAGLTSEGGMLNAKRVGSEHRTAVCRAKRGTCEWELVLHSTLAPVCFRRFFNGPQTMWEEKTMGAMT